MPPAAGACGAPSGVAGGVAARIKKSPYRNMKMYCCTPLRGAGFTGETEFSIKIIYSPEERAPTTALVPTEFEEEGPGNI